MAKTQAEIISHFPKAKVCGKNKDGNTEYNAPCTCITHRDKKPSLYFSWSKDGQFLAYCQSQNCSYDDILQGAGLSRSDVQEGYEYKAYTWRERIEYGLKQNIGEGSIVAIYDYFNAENVYQYSKVRFQPKGKPKEIRYYRIDRKSDSYQTGRGDTEKFLYNFKAFQRAVSKGQTVFYCEGEKDVDTLRDIGLTAVTAGGVKDWKPEFARYFKGAKVVILNDNDQAGIDHANTVQACLYHYAYWCQITQTSTALKGDVTDWLQNEGGTKEKLFELVDNGMKYDTRQYAPWLAVEKTYMYEDAEGNLSKDPPKDGKEAQKIVVGVNLKLICDVLADTFSDGNAFLMPDNPTDDKRQFYYYEKGVYNRLNMQSINGEIKRYMPLGTASPAAIDSTRKLLICGAYGHVCEHADLNRNERYINLRNGLYDLKERKLVSHTPKLKSTIQLVCRYDPEAPRPVFNKFIHEFCSDDEGNYNEQKELLLQEFCGLAVSNIDVSRVKRLLWLISQQGDSGKSVVLDFVSYMLGGRDYKYTINLPLQDMNEKSKFSIGALLGKRLIAVGDQSGAVIEDTSLLKSLTGGDLIKFEGKNEKPLFMRYRGAIMIASNTLPSIGGGDKGVHLFDRFLFIPCEHHVARKDADIHLREKLYMEMDGMFSWCLDGLNRLIDNGYKFTKLEAAEALVVEYRQMQDTLFRFITESGYEITSKAEDRIPRKDFESDYLQFCNENNLQPLNKAAIKNRMLSDGCGYRDCVRIGGRVTSAYTGICRKNNSETATSHPEKLLHMPDPEEFDQLTINDDLCFN